jgi:signal recognition particle GTPase
MNKFSPPEITYFEKMINSSRTPRRKSIKSYRDRVAFKKRNEKEVQNLREELQYALIMTNRNSKMIVDIVEKVSRAEKQLKPKGEQRREVSFEEKLMRTKKSQSL